MLQGVNDLSLFHCRIKYCSINDIFLFRFCLSLLNSFRNKLFLVPNKKLIRYLGNIFFEPCQKSIIDHYVRITFQNKDIFDVFSKQHSFLDNISLQFVIDMQILQINYKFCAGQSIYLQFNTQMKDQGANDNPQDALFWRLKFEQENSKNKHLQTENSKLKQQNSSIMSLEVERQTNLRKLSQALVDMGKECLQGNFEGATEKMIAHIGQGTLDILGHRFCAFFHNAVLWMESHKFITLLLLILALAIMLFAIFTGRFKKFLLGIMALTKRLMTKVRKFKLN